MASITTFESLGTAQSVCLIVALFKKELGLDSILFGFGLDSDALHSPNEHYGLFNYYKGIETIPLFYKYFTQLSQK